MKWFRDNYFKNADPNNPLTVLDVGSQCVPGQSDTYKIYFDKAPFKYTGVDMVEGYNVDIVLKHAYQWEEIPDNFCDVLVSGQTFEHIEFPWFTISEMARVLKPNGLLCVIAPSMSPLHRYPVNCQNYFADGMIALSRYAGLHVLHASTNYAPVGAPPEWYSYIQDTICIAKNPADWKADAFDKLNYTCKSADLEKMATGLIPIEKQPWYKKWLMKRRIKQYLKYMLWPLVLVRRRLMAIAR
jgi:SAM-dependent methyltransferase